jgi:hypothetical protein
MQRRFDVSSIEQAVDISMEGLMSIYVSMGVTAPQFLARQAGSEPKP